MGHYEQRGGLPPRVSELVNGAQRAQRAGQRSIKMDAGGTLSVTKDVCRGLVTANYGEIGRADLDV